MVVQQELTHELIPIIHPEVGVIVEGVSVLHRLVHDVLHAVHQLLPVRKKYMVMGL